ncbi:MAG: transporter substrate-binding domain-containing protein, partial [Cyanobacteria bacterium]|nr:transporter substrate-binding domain-containing protein [Cyanobacteriota bacterium]
DVGVWVRANSQLASADWITLNESGYRIAVTEGDITHEIALTDFIFAKWVRAPQLGKVKALLDFVADGRADATIAERITYEAYAVQMSEQLVNIAQNKPIRRYPNCFLVGKDQHDFLDLLDSFIDETISSGKAHDIVCNHITGSPESMGLYFAQSPRTPRMSPSV